MHHLTQGIMPHHFTLFPLSIHPLDSDLFYLVDDNSDVIFVDIVEVGSSEKVEWEHLQPSVY
jgi:hypothetical protein